MIREKSHLRDMTDHIKKNVQKGYSLESLRWALVKQGHHKHDIERALKSAQDEMTQEAARTSQQAASRPAPTIEPVTEPSKPFWKKLFG